MPKSKGQNIPYIRIVRPVAQIINIYLNSLRFQTVPLTIFSYVFCTVPHLLTKTHFPRKTLAKPLLLSLIIALELLEFLT